MFGDDQLATPPPLRESVRTGILHWLERESPPPGHRVRDEVLATELGVSRTPVREAMLELSRLGILRSDHRRGFRVAALDPVEVRELGQLLGALEALALRLSTIADPGLTADLEQALARLAAARGDAAATLDANEAWHERLIRGCPNARLLARLREVRLALRRYVLAFLRDAGRLGLATGGQRRIMAALEHGDAEEAARRLEQLLVTGAEELAAWLAARPQPRAEGISRSIASR